MGLLIMSKCTVASHFFPLLPPSVVVWCDSVGDPDAGGDAIL